MNGMSQHTAGVSLEFDLVDRLNKSLRVSGMSVGELADLLEVHRNTLSRYLSGRGVPDRRTLMAWAMATGVPFSWLETGAQPPEGPPGGGAWAPWGSNPQPTGYAPDEVTTRLVAA